MITFQLKPVYNGHQRESQTFLPTLLLNGPVFSRHLYEVDVDTKMDML